MGRILTKQLLTGLLTLLITITLVFFFVQIIMPGDFSGNYMFLGISQAERNAIREELGLNLPLHQQYWNWLSALLRGDMGRSFMPGRTPVTDILITTLPNSLLVFGTGLGIAYFLGQWLGKVTAWRKADLISDSMTMGALVFYAFFPPALAYLLHWLLARRLGWLPSNLETWYSRFTRDFPTFNPWLVVQDMVVALLISAGVAFIASILVRRFLRRPLPPMLALPLMLTTWVSLWFAIGYGPQALRVMMATAIPIIAMALLSIGEMMLITRTSMTDTLHEQYIQTARAKGLKDRHVRDRHAMPNAILPVISKVVISLPYLLGGLTIIEYSTGWSGMGLLLFSSADNQDIPVILGILLMIGVLVIVSRIVLEMLYALLDPRIRVGNR